MLNFININLRPATYTFIATVLLVVTSVSHAEIYRWTDEAGKVHFSDKPIGDKATEVEVNVNPVVKENPQNSESRKLRTEQYLRGREQERAELDKQRKEKKELEAKRKKNCLTAKKEYKKATEATAVYYKNKDGTRDYLDDTRRKKAEAQAKADVKRWCK